MLCQHIVIGDAVILHRSGVLDRVGAVNTVYVFGKQNHICVNFRSPQHSRRVCGEIGIASAGAENDHAALFQMPDSLGADVRLRDGAHFNGGLHPDGDSLLLADIRHGQTVHNGRQHSDMVSAAALHFAAAAVLGAPPKIAATDNKAHLNAHVQTSLDRIAHLTDHLKIQTGVLISRQRLAADFQQNTMINRFFHIALLWHIILSFILPYFPPFGKGVTEDFHRKIKKCFFLEIPPFFTPQPIVDNRVVAKHSPVWYTEGRISPDIPIQGGPYYDVGTAHLPISKTIKYLSGGAW